MNFQALHFSSEDEGDESSLSSYDSSEDEFSNDSLKGGIKDSNRQPLRRSETNRNPIFTPKFNIGNEMTTIRGIRPMNNENIYEKANDITIRDIINQIQTDENKIVIGRVQFTLINVKENNRDDTHALTVLLDDIDFNQDNITNFIEYLYDKKIFIFINCLHEYHYEFSRFFHHAHSFMYYDGTVFKKFIIYFSTRQINNIYTRLFDTYNVITDDCNLFKIKQYIEVEQKSVDVLFTNDTIDDAKINDTQYTTIITKLNNNTIDNNYILALLFIFASIEDEIRDPKLIKHLNLVDLYHHITKNHRHIDMKKNWKNILYEYDSVIIYKILKILEIPYDDNDSIIINWRLTNKENLMKYIMINHIFNNNRLIYPHDRGYITIVDAIYDVKENDIGSGRNSRYNNTEPRHVNVQGLKVYQHIISILFKNYTINEHPRNDDVEELYEMYKNIIDEDKINSTLGITL